MLARKLACPSCSVRLKVEETLAAGSVIKCPKCGKGFAVPGKNGAAASPRAAATRPRKVVPPPEEPEEEEPDEEVEERPAPRKFRKMRKKKAGSGALVWGLVIGAALLVIGGGVAAAVIWRNSQKKNAPVAANAPATSAPASRDERSGTRDEPAGEPSRSMAAPAPGEMRMPAPDTRMAAAGSRTAGAGRAVYEAQNCGRCHAPGDAAAGMPMRRNRGPDLATVGRDPSHTVAWLMDHVRNARSHKPDSRMPPFEGKINEADLRALGEYLASLK